MSDRKRWTGKRRKNCLLAMKKRSSDAKKDSFIKSVYGITMSDYYKMLKRQKGVCKICGGKETRIDKYHKKICRLHIDHDHKNGKVRGLLCHKCNNGLGQFQDNIKLLEKAKQYLNGGYYNA